MPFLDTRERIRGWPRHRAEILQKKDADVPRQTAPARAELLLQVANTERLLLKIHQNLLGGLSATSGTSAEWLPGHRGPLSRISAYPADSESPGRRQDV